jgi:flagellar biosynthesis/type III secretory pathway chaperone
MASLMENLIDILEKEVTEYKALLELSEQKTPIIIRGDTIALQQITDDEQEVVGHLSHLDRDREDVMKDIGNVLNKDVNSLKLHVIIRLLEERPDEQKRLSKVHDELQTVVQSVARINEQNKALIKQQLEMVEFDLNLIKSMNSAPETAEYNRTAAVNGNYMGGMAGSFDAKQ